MIPGLSFGQVLGGIRNVFAAAVTLAADAFTDTAATTLASHTATGGGSWALAFGASSLVQITSGNRVRNTSAGQTSLYIHSYRGSGSVPLKVSADLVVLATGVSFSAGIVLGRSTGGYFVRCTEGGALALFPITSGGTVGSQIGSTYNIPSFGVGTYKISLEWQTNGDLAVDVADVPVITGNNTTYASLDRAGIRVFAASPVSDSTHAQWDNWLLESI